MGYKLLTKKIVDERANIKAINTKIEELKKTFRKRKYGHIGELYETLSAIVRLKQEIDPKYAPRSLEWEKGLNLKSSQIRYIFAYQYISSYTKKKVEEGLIDDNTICHALAVSSIIREPQWQQRLVDKLISKEMKPSFISELTIEEIKNVLLGKKKVIESDKYFLSVAKTLRNTKHRIKRRRTMLKDSPFRNELLNAIRELNKLMNEIEGRNWK